MPRQYGEFSHEDLNNFYGWRFIPGNDYTGSGTGIKDQNGHGTHVTGIAAANSNNNIGITGVNHQSKVLVIKTNDEGGSWLYNWFYQAVLEASDYSDLYNKPVVINFSSVAANHDDVLVDAINYANNKGVLIVCSAGNLNGQVQYPARYSENYSNVIAVGATNHYDTRSTYSNYGLQLNITAPGGNENSTNSVTNLYSTMPDYEVSRTKWHYNENYDYMSGTSMAAPQVAATAALMLSLDPDLTPAQLRSMLENSAYKVDGMNGEDFTEQYGYGRLDANMALVEVLKNKSSLLDDMLDIFGPDYVCESGGTFLLENLPEGFDQPQWTVTPSYMFNGSTSGTGIEAIVTPKPQYIGANASITYTVSGDWGSVSESMNFTLIGPKDDQLSINVVPSSGDAPWPIYTSGVWLVCPNTVYHIHINNSSDCQVYDFDWNLPSAWSVYYQYDNMISVNTNHDPSGTLEVYAKTCCYTNEPNKVKIKTQNFGMAYNCN